LYWDIDLELHITLLALQFHLLEESHGRVWDNEKFQNSSSSACSIGIRRKVKFIIVPLAHGFLFLLIKRTSRALSELRQENGLGGGYAVNTCYDNSMTSVSILT
jgi:hypothetical protein